MFPNSPAHPQERIREDYTQWLKWLRNSIGFDGWRLDFVRGFPGSTLKSYIDDTVPAMAFGEFWDSCEYTDGVLNYNQDAHRWGFGVQVRAARRLTRGAFMEV